MRYRIRQQLPVEDIPNIDAGKLRYDMFVKAYNETREHGGINGLTPSEMFLQTFNISHNRNDTTQKSVTHLGNQNCYLSVQLQQIIKEDLVIPESPIRGFFRKCLKSRQIQKRISMI